MRLLFEIILILMALSSGTMIGFFWGYKKGVLAVKKGYHKYLFELDKENPE